ncbi:right-handed parallel beta-helix repeat-containing protein [Pseudonocardia hydrocarbonoxydans]|uniref:Right handed beta helix domain-containing protein n=1 Tax=Pseudonocardia hydrocarbonoxydans TaxID=76726 RepID=A0A4Y3WK37_9PSEU|nr:right-handed parallel beta-helix repeat-containing protein [Pseudonocardia hydrocarbonoxydans]GEC19144.1 hypothetical protein PHY01_14270 [Pseudonocardia hydrocarbonoxydans]
MTRTRTSSRLAVAVATAASVAVAVMAVHGTAGADVPRLLDTAAAPCEPFDTAAEPLVGSAVRARSGTVPSAAPAGLDCVPADDGPTAPARPYFDAADWLWNPVPQDPELDPQSAAMVEQLARGDHIANTGDFAVTLRGVDGITEDTPRFPVSFAQEGSWGPDPFAGETVPIPENTPIAPGSDGHLAVADPISNMVYNLWMAEDGGNTWNAGWGAMTPLDGDGREENGSSTGAGLARYAAVVRAEEIAAGEIPHALFFSTNMAAPDEVRYPATKTDGSNMDGVDTPIPEGARVQLDPSLDLDSLDMTEGERTVARALQTHGAYVGDNGGARMAFLFEYVPDSSVYEDAGLSGDYAPMDGIPWDRLQVLADWNGGQDPDAAPPAAPADDPTADDEPVGDRVARDEPAADAPERGGPAADQPQRDRPAGDRPAADEPADDRPTDVPPMGDRPDRPADDPPSDDPGGDRPGTGTTARSPSGDSPTGTAGPRGPAAGEEPADTGVTLLRDIGEPAEGAAGGSTITVGEGGDHSSIQDAVDAAQPGDTVEIAEGTYEGFSVDGGGTAEGWLTIRAAEGAEVVVEGGGGSDQGLVDINGASYLRMIGLTVRGSGSHGVYGAGTDHVVLRDCRVTGSSDGGIVVLDSTDLLVQGCEVDGNNARGTDASNEAISIVNTDGFEIVDNDVRDNGEEGIDAKYEARNGVIHLNRVEGNRGPNIYVDSARDIEVLENVVTGATETSKSGIGLAVENFSETRRLDNVTIRDNVIEDNAGAGVDFWIEGTGSISGVTIEGNRFSGNGRGAITFNADSFSGENSIIDNLFADGDEPPGERSSFRLTGNSLTEAVGEVLGG